MSKFYVNKFRWEMIPKLYLCISENDEIAHLIEVSGLSTETVDIHVDCLEEITLEEYQMLYPNERIDNDTIENNKYESLVEGGEPYSPTPEEIEELYEEIAELLNKYGYDYSKVSVVNILLKFFKNKGPLINAFKNHPHYNGKYQIVFEQSFDRKIDVYAIYQYANWLNTVKMKVLSPIVIENYSIDDFNDLYNDLHSLPEEKRADIINQFIAHYDKYGHYNTVESRNNFDAICYYANIVEAINVTFLRNSDVEIIKNFFPDLHVTEGMKTSRVMNKIAKIVGVDKNPDWNREFSRYSDAVNPLKITRHTILSLHPVDYLTMSFGNSWSSCHTIDKKNKRKMPSHYEGCYSAGTMSYMLDGVSLVFYTVDEKYEGNKMELEDKINRCMFHVGHDKIVQGRLYPQANDGDTNLYADVRQIVQNIIASIFEVSNFWTLKRGSSYCSKAIISQGEHYRDYLHFEYCNVSYLKRLDGIENDRPIIVGHNVICPNCGVSHNRSENILCDDCDVIGRCTACGNPIEDDDYYIIDGEYYCDECTFYCDYHDRREVGREYERYVDDYGTVCFDALYYSGAFAKCKRCNEWFYRYSDCIETSDDNIYCCEGCAEMDGYTYHEDMMEWRPTEEVVCKKCGCLLSMDDILDGCDLCADCRDEACNETENAEEVA